VTRIPSRAAMLLAVAVLASACASSAPSGSADPEATSSPATTASSPASATAQPPSPSGSIPPGSSAPAASSAAPEPSPTAAATTDVAIRGFVFQPATVQVRVGDTVRWTNDDQASHTVTSGLADEPDGRFDTGRLESRVTSEITFATPGTFPYFCNLHPRMTGTIEVSP